MDEQHLRVLSWNVGLLYYRFLGITWIANTNVQDRIVLVIGRIQEHDADIVALQEFYDYCEIEAWTRNILPMYPYIARGHLPATFDYQVG